MQNKYYLLHVFRERLGYPELKQATVERARRFQPDAILIEDKSSGTALIQDLRAQGLHNVEAYRPKGDKIMRMHSQTATIKNGAVFVPADASWVADYLHELTSFYFGKHDDQVDSTSQFLDWAKVIEPHFLMYMRRQSERMTHPLRPTQKLKRAANCDVSTIYFMNGESINVPADGLIDVRHEDAGPLIQVGWMPVE
ncbi:phage terminase large subunit [Bradyrhizobium sp. CCGUVB23]|uniref:phage terminase large subunit n=1 Tax=Bradyrhizobium sp. CCGUVB23 TaxID=2949630 RepID=UPI0020B2D297|nr:phage terminase large subunit [Bradyrhizobium sp. CCGUVB23]MCP3460023.1 phage terminase large subunit [Bradyrhizobium sp. CCGUVB23]